MDKRLTTLAKLLAFAGVLGLLYVVLKSIGFRAIMEAIGGVDRRAVGTAAALYFLMYVVLAVRVHLMMGPEDRGGLLPMFVIYLAGVFGNVVTPGARVGGEPIRACYMTRAFGGPTSRHFGVLFADKLGNLAVFMVFVLASVSFVALFVPVPLTTKIVLEVAMLVVILGVVSGFLLHRHFVASSSRLSRLLRGMYNAPVLEFLRRGFRTYQHFEAAAIRKLDNVFGTIGRIATNPTSVSRAISLSVVAWLLLFGAHYVLFRALGAKVSFFGVIIIVSISTFVGDISVAPGGAGFMEAAMIGLCAALGVQHHTAAAVTLISRGIFYLFGLGLGGLSLLTLACIYGPQRENAAASDEIPRGAGGDDERGDS